MLGTGGRTAFIKESLGGISPLPLGWLAGPFLNLLKVLGTKEYRGTQLVEYTGLETNL